jgi:hypothetical protein
MASACRRYRSPGGEPRFGNRSYLFTRIGARLTSTAETDQARTAPWSVAGRPSSLVHSSEGPLKNTPLRSVASIAKSAVFVLPEK